MPAYSDIQRIVNQIQTLAEVSGKARPEVTELQAALQALLRPGAAAGTIQFMSRDELIRLREAREAVGALGGIYRQLDFHVQKALASISALSRQAIRTQTGVFGRVPTPMIGGQLGTVQAGLKGPEAQAQAFLASTQKQLSAQLSLESGLQRIRDQYTAVGATVEVTKQQLDLVTNTWSIQAEVLKQTGAQLEYVRSVQAQVSAATGEILPPTPLQGTLQGMLRPQQLAQLNKELDKMGMSMGNLTNIQTDAVNGITRFSFKTVDASGAVKTANYHIDRWKRLLGDTSTRFKSFNDMIARNISKVAEWAIAVGLIFGAWRKAQEMTGFMVEIESTMADLTIVTGESADALGNYFDEIVNISNVMSVDVADTLKAATDAMRATAGEGPAGAAQAMRLLEDAASLALLANIDMAKSTDLLVSSLKQLNMPLTEGDKLLEKWVAVSKIAKVSILDLAQGYAVAGAAADAAGADVDEFNAMLATMATVTNLSARENANALRAMFAAVQTPSTQKILEKYGIAIKEVDRATGEFTGNLRDIPDILEDVARLLDAGILDPKALGEIGGALGGQGARRQAQFVSFLKQYSQSMRIANVSAEAHGNLQDAISIKSQTLRAATQRLDNAFKELAETLGTEGGMVDAFTGLVEGLTSVVKFLDTLTEKLGPATTAVAGFMLAWGVGTKFALPERMNALGSRMFDWGGARGGMAGGAAQQAGMGVSQYGGAGAYGAVAGIMTGLATGSAVQGIGTGIATAFGFAAGGPIGGMVGSVIGQAFTSEVEKAYEAFGGEVAGMTTVQLREARDLVAQQLEGMGGRGPMFGGPIPREMVTEQLIERLRELDATIAKVTRAERVAAGKQVFMEETEYQRRAGRYQEAYAPGLEREMRQRRMELPFEFARGDIESAREYNAAVQRTYDIMSKMNPIFYAMETAVRETGGSMKDTTGSFVDMGTEIAGWSDEATGFLLDMALAFGEFHRAAIESGEGLDFVEDKATQLIEVYQGLKREQARQAFEIPGFKDFSDLTQQEFEAIRMRAAELQDQFAQDLGIPQEAFDSIERWALLVDQSFQWEGSVMQQFFQQARQEAKDAASDLDDSFNVRRLKDVDPSKMAEIARANRYWVEYLARLKGLSAQQYLNMEGQQFNLILGPGNVLQQLYSTSEAMLFALQDIKEIEEKQLEGMWNIPSGATFWVPITSLFYQGQEAGGYPELPELLPPTERTASNTTEIASTGRQSLNAIYDGNRGAALYHDKMLRIFAMEEAERRGDLPEYPGTAQKDIMDITEDEMEAYRMRVNKLAYAERGVPEWDLEMRRMGKLEEEPTTIEQFFAPLLEILTTAFPEGREPSGLPAPEAMDPLATIAQRLEEFTQSILSAIGLAPTERIPRPDFPGRKPHRADIPAYMEPPPVDVQVDIPEIKGEFAIRNVVVLDGRQIQMYVNRILARALSRAIRANARSTTGQLR